MESELQAGVLTSRRLLISILAFITTLVIYLALCQPSGTSASETPDGIPSSLGTGWLEYGPRIDVASESEVEVGGPISKRALTIRRGGVLRLSDYSDSEISLALFYNHYIPRGAKFEWWFHRQDFTERNGLDTRLYPPGTVGFVPAFGIVSNSSEAQSGISYQEFVSFGGKDVQLIPGDYYWEVRWTDNGIQTDTRLKFAIVE